MTFYLIGTGRMAQFIATRLLGKGPQCLGIFGRNAEAAAQLAGQLGAPVLKTLSILPQPADAVLLAVSDSAIPFLAQQLPPQQGTVVHFSGTVSLHALLPHEGRAVCWPLYSIGTDIFPEIQIPAGSESSHEKARQTLESLAEALVLRLFDAPEATRRQLHLAAVFGNNFVNHLLCICEKLCREAALPQEVIRPLLAQTFARAISGNPCEMQTGPARRGDLGTQARHLGLLSDHPEWQRVYEAISDSIGHLYPVH